MPENQLVAAIARGLLNKAKRKQELLDAFAAGDFGQVEFFELAMDAGLSLQEIEAALQEDDESL